MHTHSADVALAKYPAAPLGAVECFPKALAPNKPAGIKLLLKATESMTGEGEREWERERTEALLGVAAETKTKLTVLSVLSLLTLDISTASARES